MTGVPSAALQDLIAAAAGADGMILLTPILNSSYSGLLKMFVDLLPFGALQGKPVLIAATGGSARHGLCLDFTLRPLLTYLKADVISSSVYVTGNDLAGERFAARVESATGELVARLLAGDPATVS
ncbi:hypothetical protein GCM10009554_61910 [Kribbella koreensis]|uniref:NADPH-dependent FMN reductase-like domain-containing protein n=1 Tax=Kribbella koreensis TaxID=57909 RepID=A0ABP4BUB1_9ACTN